MFDFQNFLGDVPRHIIRVQLHLDEERVRVSEKFITDYQNRIYTPAAVSFHKSSSFVSISALFPPSMASG